MLLEVLAIFLLELLEAFDFTLDRNSLLVEDVDFVSLTKFGFGEHSRHLVLALFDDSIAFGVTLLNVLIVQFPSELKELARCAGLGRGGHRARGSERSTTALKFGDTGFRSQNLLVQPIVLELNAAKFFDDLVEKVIDVIGVITVAFRLRAQVQ